jgi:hypothetical protein
LTEPHSQPVEPRNYVASIQGKFAGTICDLVSIQEDLTFARDTAVKCLADMPPGEPQSGQQASSEQAMMAKAVWSASLTSYRRAFAVGRGHVVPKAQRFDIQGLREEQLSPAQKATDLELRDIIDKHIAHRTSDLEQMRLLIFLNPPPLPRGVAGVGPFSIHHLSPKRELVEALIEICDVLLAPINQAINQMLERARQLAETNSIYRLYDEIEGQ